MLQPLVDDADHDVVGHEVTVVHVRLASCPKAVPSFTAARSMSPVEMWGTT